MRKGKTFSSTAIKISLRLMIIMMGGLLVWVYSNLDTEYAENYSENGFNNIMIGMKKEEVKQIIGEPLWINHIKSGSEEVWGYSQQGADKRANYFERLIRFNETGTVILKKKQIYID